MRLVCHGGAGGAPDEPDPRQGVLDEAAETGAAADGAVEAVVAAADVLEGDERFNAGVGGAVQSDGVVRTDAGLMTSDRDAGAVASLAGVENAAAAARVVMEETPHVFVAGDHAVDLAAEFGVGTGVDLSTDATRERFESADPPDGSPREHLAWVDERYAGHDTVGAVAYDPAADEFAACTSTGGRFFALAGRVGDVPQVGSGFFAAPAGAASATGAGEDIAKATLTRRAVRHLEAGSSAQGAADRAMAEFGELTGSDAGVIVQDEAGVGSAFNTEAMQTAVARSE
ncbi:isoaspartyl peptidase/L-asparaginase [Candidatus Halobonum tyrrellensis]|uniref:Plant-type L-asparaginase n=1 Tax=Candidatus Halobonum tyrrellensis G22 TaxID=1324957 RepID=V4HCR8_9EURY|nr:isoaspartyl peptidase/L-asparaginase [Candidatus Halobonum tyrrellensis]ESP87833.1 asparaginase [Candidatus Halobonum tyrrellensis G22]